jgi:hypothetical protein
LREKSEDEEQPRKEPRMEVDDALHHILNDVINVNKPIEGEVNMANSKYGHALPHFFTYAFELSAEDPTKQAVHIPLVACDEGLTNPENVNVNPKHTARTAEQAHHTIYPDSYVDGFMVDTKIYAKQQDSFKMHSIIYQSMVIAGGFEDFDVKDENDATIASLLALKKETTNENQVHPDWNGTDIGHSANLDAAYVGLTGGQTMEAADFTANDWTNLREGLKQSSVKEKLRKITKGGFKNHVIRYEQPSWRRGYVENPVKRAIENSYVGIMAFLPQSSWTQQFYHSDETDATKLHLGMKIEVSFNEYNNEFYQGMA